MVSAQLIKAIMVPWDENSNWILEGSHVVQTRLGGVKIEVQEAKLASF